MVSPYVFYYQLNQGGIIENVMFSFSLFIAENKEIQQQSNKAYLNDVHISPRLINYVDFRRCGLCVFRACDSFHSFFTCLLRGWHKHLSVCN